MKNLKYVLASFIFLSPILTFAYGEGASITISPQEIYSNGWYSTPIEFSVNLPTETTVIIIFKDGVKINEIATGDYVNNEINYGVANDFISNYEGVGVYDAIANDITNITACSDYDYCGMTGTDMGGVFIVNQSPVVANTGLFHTKNLLGEVSNSPSDLVASVGVVSMGVYGSVLPYMYIVIGIGVAFYILQRLLEVMPKDKKSKIKSYDIVSEKTKDGTYHAKFIDKQ